MIEQVKWLGHGSFVIDSDPLIYINPWRVARVSRPADVILIGHEHYAYCSPADIAKLRGPNTQVIASRRAAEHLDDCTVLRPWQSIAVGRACIKGIPAYVPEHGTPDDGRLGFVISVNYFDIYYAGHTGFTPEMKSLQPDIAILPIDGEGTMSASEAAQAIMQMHPRWAIPCNWGFNASGTNRVDAQIFASEVGASSKVILPAMR